MHFFKRETKGKDAFMAMKLDIYVKVYDRIQWAFLKKLKCWLHLNFLTNELI